MQLALQRRQIPRESVSAIQRKKRARGGGAVVAPSFTPRLMPRLTPRLIPRLTPRSTPRGAPLELRCATSVVGVFYFPAPLGRASGRPGRGKVRKSRRRLDNRRVRSCCGHVHTSGVRRCGQKQTATNFADRCIAAKFWANQGLQNPRTTNLMDKIPDHGAHFATERPLVVKNRGSKLFETFPFLKCRACLYKVASNRVLNKVDLLSDLTGLAA